MLERRDDYGFDYHLHEAELPARIQWHFAEDSKLPVGVQSWEIPVGGNEGMHTHHADPQGRALDEIYLITEGSARMTVDGVTHDLGPGDAVLASAGADHDLVNIGDVPLRLVFVFGYQGEADYSQFKLTKLAFERRAKPA